MDEPDDARLPQAYSHSSELLREGDRERWLCNLFAPAAVRPHLNALYAFSLEIARIRDVVSDPRPGEIRYQWWRELIEGEPRGDIAAHPLAHAVLDTIRKFRLPGPAFTNLVDARTFDLYDDPMPGMRQLEGYCGETCSALFRLTSIILAEGRGPGGADVVGHAGVAYALTGLLRALPWHAARGQVYLPADAMARHGVARQDVIAGKNSPELASLLAEMRQHARSHLAKALVGREEIAEEARIALLPLAMVEPYLRRMETRSYNPFATPVTLPQWRLQWILWSAARSW